MDEEQQAKAREKALTEDLKAYKKLDRINQTEEFDAFFQLQIATVVQKMLSLFTGQPKTHDEYLALRGEIVAYLYPIQQIRGAKVMAKQLQEQLDNIYNQPL